jgi:hypothetical protein
METISFRNKWLNVTAMFLLFPAVYFISISVLKYSLGVPGPYDASEPTLEWLGMNESFGWNINLVFALGPVLAFLLAALQVVHIKWILSKEEFKWYMTIRKKSVPLFIMFLSVLVLGTLFVYIIAENLTGREIGYDLFNLNEIPVFDDPVFLSVLK